MKSESRCRRRTICCSFIRSRGDAISTFLALPPPHSLVQDHRHVADLPRAAPVLRDRPAFLRPRFNAEAESLSISTVVLTELLHGAARSAHAYLALAQIHTTGLTIRRLLHYVATAQQTVKTLLSQT